MKLKMASSILHRTNTEECSRHPGEKIKAVCNTCDKPTCIECLLGDHNGHKVTEITQAYQDKTRSLEKLCKELEETQDYFEYKMNEIPFREEELKSEFDSLKEIIEQNGQNLKDRIDKMTNACIANAEMCRKNNQEKIDKIKNNLDKYSAHNMSFMTQVNSKTKNKGIRNIMALERGIRKHLNTAFQFDNLAFPELEIPQFSPGRYKKEDLTKIFGQLSTEEVEQEEEEEEEGHLYDYISVEARTPEKYIDDSRTFNASNKAIVSICPLTITQAWIRDETGRELKMMNELGYVIRTVSEVSKKSDIAITPEGAVLVSCPEKYCIKKYVQDGSIRIFIRTGSLQPHCLSVQYSTGNILVGLVDKWSPTIDASSERLIQMYSSKGDVLQQIVHSKTSLGIFSRGPRHFVMPYKVKVNEQNGDVVVVNWTTQTHGQLILLSSGGDIKFKYPSDSQDPFLPNDVLFMGESSFVVSDEETQSLILLNYQGVFQKVIQKFRHIPRSLGNFGKGKIWIGMNDGSIEIHQIDEDIP